ncbi:putative fluoride ion transporter CrcB [Pseudoxanthomonas indica]|nr:putative fluoride ion transporter CrcB [Pseudoxanthomonas indica]
MPVLQSLFAIALGATLGAWARWGLSIWLNPADGPFPYGTLAANLIGGYVIGMAMAWFSTHPQVSPEWRLFVITGLLGGLTTFSSFSAETMQLILRQQYGWAATVIGSHVFGSLLMTALGIASVRLLR